MEYPVNDRVFGEVMDLQAGESGRNTTESLIRPWLLGQRVGSIRGKGLLLQ